MPSLCRHRRLVSSGFLGLLLIVQFAPITAQGQETTSDRQFTARGRQSVVATVQPLATQAGMDAYAAGGNAVDAAVAAALTLGVVDSHNSGLGGGCFILIRQPNGEFLAVDGRETAPAAATTDMFVRDGKAVAELSQTGPLASGVPGALAAYAAALDRAGKLPLAQLLQNAATVAENGFPIDRIMARNLRNNQQTLARFPATAAVLLRQDGQPLREGDMLTQTDLAKTYRAIADDGPAWFYQNEFAQRTAAWMKDHGGILTAEDFRGYEAKDRVPIRTTYRNLEIIGFPPPSSGGVHVAQILNILEAFDLRALHEQDPALLVHVVAEAMKLAFADRAYWLGDADFARVPRGLIDKTYAGRLAKQIRLDAVLNVPRQGLPPDWETNVFGKHTTHIAAADNEGYWVAITATINTSFGSKVMVPGTGLLLNNQMDDFSAQPGVPNAFGLVGNANNRVEPGKRPLSSMSPTIVLRDGQPIMTLGAAGGPKIITQVVLGIIGVADLGWPLDRALAAPRWHHQWRPDTLFVEDRMAPELVRALNDRGHRVEVLGAAGVSQGIQRLDDGAFLGVHDPRVPGRAAAR